MDESTTTQVFDMVDLAFELADEMARAVELTGAAKRLPVE